MNQQMNGVDVECDTLVAIESLVPTAAEFESFGILDLNVDGCIYFSGTIVPLHAQLQRSFHIPVLLI